MVNYKKMLMTFGCLGCLIVSSIAAAEVVVVVNTANNNEMNQSEIKRLFLGKKSKFPDGSAAKPVGQDDKSDVVKEFNQKVLGKSASQLKAYWSKLIFTGKGSPPKKLGSDAEVLKAVAGDASKIGFVNSASVDGSVKVLLKL